MDQRPLPPLVIPSIELTSPEVTDSEEDSRRDSSNLKEVKLPFDGLKSTLEDSKISSPDSEHSKSSSSIRHAIDKDTSAHIKIVFKWSAIACSIFLVPLAVIVFNITDDVGEFAKYFSTMTAIVILFTVPVTHFYVVRRRKAVEATRQEAKEAALQLEQSAFHMNNLEYEEPDMNLHMTPYLQNGMRPAIMPSMSMSSHPGSPAAIVELPQTPEPRRHNPFLSLEAPSDQRPRIDGHLYRPQSLRSLHDFREAPASPHALTHARSTSTLPRIQKTSLHELHAPHRRPLQRPQSMHSLQQSFDDQIGQSQRTTAQRLRPARSVSTFPSLATPSGSLGGDGYPPDQLWRPRSMQGLDTMRQEHEQPTGYLTPQPPRRKLTSTGSPRSLRRPVSVPTFTEDPYLSSPTPGRRATHRRVTVGQPPSRYYRQNTHSSESEGEGPVTPSRSVSYAGMTTPPHGRVSHRERLPSPEYYRRKNLIKKVEETRTRQMQFLAVPQPNPNDPRQYRTNGVHHREDDDSEHHETSDEEDQQHPKASTSSNFAPRSTTSGMKPTPSSNSAGVRKNHKLPAPLPPAHRPIFTVESQDSLESIKEDEDAQEAVPDKKVSHRRSQIQSPLMRITEQDSSLEETAVDTTEQNSSSSSNEGPAEDATKTTAPKKTRIKDSVVITEVGENAKTLPRKPDPKIVLGQGHYNIVTVTEKRTRSFSVF